MWYSNNEIEGWVRVLVRKSSIWVMPPTDRNFELEVMSSGKTDEYLNLIRRIPQIASLSLLLAQMEGDAISANRWWLNMRKLLGEGNEGRH